MPSKQASSMDESNENEFLGEPIDQPHPHDVLSGRGNFVNHHPGNEHFRQLVKTHKVRYVKAPKSKKPEFSKMIYDAIRNQDPPGRFLKQDETTKLWYEISDRKAVDKTRQALREGAPEIKGKIAVSAAPATADGGSTTIPDAPNNSTNDNTPVMKQKSSTKDFVDHDFAAHLEEKLQTQMKELQELQFKLQQQRELLQTRNESAAIGTSGANTNLDLLINQQQLMASNNSWNDIRSILMDPSFISSNSTSTTSSAAMLSAYLNSNSSILGGMGNNISISDFALASNLNLLGQSTNALGSPWNSGIIGMNALSNSGNLSNSSGSIGQMGQNTSNFVVHSNNFSPLPQLAPTLTPSPPLANPAVNQCQLLQQQYHPFPLEHIMGGQVKQQHQQQSFAMQQIDLMPPPQQVPSSVIESNSQQSKQQKSILKNGALSRDTRSDGTCREAGAKGKESHNNNPQLTRMGGLPREESLRLGDILVGEAPNVRRLSSNCMSFSMGDVDSTLSKMLEDSLDLDGPSQSQQATNSLGSQSTSANNTNINSHSSTVNTFFTSSSLLSNSGNLSIMDAAAAAVAAAYHRPSTISNNTAPLNHAGYNDDHNIFPRGSMKTEGSLSFLELLDFDEQYEASFRLDDDKL